MGGASRDLEISTIRHVEQGYAYTQIEVSQDRRCPKCGHRMDTFTMDEIDNAGFHDVVGSMSKCPKCDKDCWLYHAYTPSAKKAARLRRKTVV